VPEITVFQGCWQAVINKNEVVMLIKKISVRLVGVMLVAVMVAGLYLAIRYFNLTMTAAVLEKFFAVILIVMIVIFQEELRNFFERIATLWSFRNRANGKPSRLTREEVEVLSRTLVDLASRHRPWNEQYLWYH